MGGLLLDGGTATRLMEMSGDDSRILDSLAAEGCIQPIDETMHLFRTGCAPAVLRVWL